MNMRKDMFINVFIEKQAASYFNGLLKFLKEERGSLK